MDEIIVNRGLTAPSINDISHFGAQSLNRSDLNVLVEAAKNQWLEKYPNHKLEDSVLRAVLAHAADLTRRLYVYHYSRWDDAIHEARLNTTPSCSSPARSPRRGSTRTPARVTLKDVATIYLTSLGKDLHAVGGALFVWGYNHKGPNSLSFPLHILNLTGTGTISQKSGQSNYTPMSLNISAASATLFKIRYLREEPRITDRATPSDTYLNRIQLNVDNYSFRNLFSIDRVFELAVDEARRAYQFKEKLNSPQQALSVYTGCDIRYVSIRDAARIGTVLKSFKDTLDSLFILCPGLAKKVASRIINSTDLGFMERRIPLFLEGRLGPLTIKGMGSTAHPG